MNFKLKTKHALLAAALLAAPGVAFADNDVADQANKVTAEAQDLQQASNNLAMTVDQQSAGDNVRAADNDGDRSHSDGDDHDGFPWGLLGLLGVAGLFGLKRREDDHHHHVDHRDYDPAATRTTAGTNKTGTTGTTTGTTGTRL